MSSIDCNKTIALIEFRDGAIHTDNYRTRLDMVLSVIDLGSIGDGCHGNAAHRETLAKVVEKASAIIHLIDNPPKRSCNMHDDCDAADKEYRDCGHVSEHCHDDSCEDCFGS